MIAVIAGGGSNIASVLFALQRLQHEAILTTDADIIRQASHVILPGVGHAAHAMAQLNNSKLIPLIQQLSQPVLGICLGMHLLFEHSAEGNVDCLGIIPGKVMPLKKLPTISLPHMGWNTLTWEQTNCRLQTNIADNMRVYFVHNFAAPVNDYCIASCLHGERFAAISNHRNFYGMQFHPERSGSIGEQLLANFLTL